MGSASQPKMKASDARGELRGAKCAPAIAGPYRSEFGVEGEDESSEELDDPGIFGLESTRLTFTRPTPLSVKPIFSAARFDRSRLRLPT